MRGNARLLAGAVIAACLIYLWLSGRGLTSYEAQPPGVGTSNSSQSAAPSARDTWGNMASLPDHFAQHGSEFGARDAKEYAEMAWQFLQRAKAEGLPAKLDRAGNLRVFDPRSGAFGAYNRDGTTKTFFKPGSRGYFERQPGQSVDLRTRR